MGKPLAFGQFQIGEGSLEGRVFRAARKDTECDTVFDIEHMADAHLMEVDARPPSFRRRNRPSLRLNRNHIDLIEASTSADAQSE